MVYINRFQIWEVMLELYWVLIIIRELVQLLEEREEATIQNRSTIERNIQVQWEEQVFKSKQ